MIQIERVLEYRAKLNIGELVAKPFDNHWIVNLQAEHNGISQIISNQQFDNEEAVISAMPRLAAEINSRMDNHSPIPKYLSEIVTQKDLKEIQEDIIRL